jgi:immune inhibitor A
MTDRRDLLCNFERIRRAAMQSDDGLRCAVAPHPELRDKIKRELVALRAARGGVLGALAQAAEPRRPGLNDGMIIPPNQFPLGTALSVIRNAGAQRAPLRGVVRVIVVLVDFDDLHMTQTADHFQNLFFSTGVIPTKSVHEYYQEVTHGLLDIQGKVAGPFRLQQTLATYAHGASGLGGATPNAATMARDAVQASDPTVDFAPFDNDGNGFVDAFIVIHAGPGAEVTGSPNQIWSHKWVLDGGAQNVDNTKIFAYLTVPEDAKIGVCCHELGHLLFGFPDLYDTDGSSEGIGNWCLMAAGSWGGGGDTPVHPSAWCKANQGWVAVDNRTSNSVLSIPDVKSSNTVYRLWKDGAAGSEYFLMENRERNGFDASLPGPGLLIWHIDESVPDNTNEAHYKVALMQADGQRDLEAGNNRGDAGDPYSGSSGNANFNDGSNPNSKSYSGIPTCVSLTGISAAAPVMTANVAVRC